MGAAIGTICGTNIFEYEYDKWKDKANEVIADGMILKLYQWLNDKGYEVSIDELYNNTSGIRNENQIQLFDNYEIDEVNHIEISYMYYYNGTVWAVLYHKPTDSWYGEFEL